MKKILFPTDFSEDSRNALAYAVEMAKAMKADSIHIIYILLPETTAAFDYAPPVASLMEARLNMLKEFVLRQEDKLQPAPVQFTREVLVGFAADEIKNASEDYDLLIMGTTGESNMLENIFGKVSASVARGARCPVLLIPPASRFHLPKSMTYAIDGQKIQANTLNKLATFNRAWGAHIHFVHVKEKNEQSSISFGEDWIRSATEQGLSSISYDVVEVEDGSVSTGITHFTESTKSDIVIFTTKKRSFWDNIFHRSKTRHMALGTHHPLLVLHQ